MAIYHCSTKPLARSSGRSAVAAAAYRSGECLVDERQGIEHDYTRRSGVVHAELVLPEGSGEWTRSQLWNAAEGAEKRKDGRTAREWEFALPSELSDQGRRELAVRFAQSLSAKYGCAVDVAVHEPDREGDERNWHAHLLATTRKISNTSLGEKCEIELSDAKRLSLGLEPGRKEVEAVREMWAQHVNERLSLAGQGERVDHRSLAAQRDEAIWKNEPEKAAALDRAPQVKLGWKVVQMERRGEPSDRGDQLREVKRGNGERKTVVLDIGQLRAQLVEREEAKRQTLLRSVEAKFKGLSKFESQEQVQRWRGAASRKTPEIEHAKSRWEHSYTDREAIQWRQTGQALAQAERRVSETRAAVTGWHEAHPIKSAMVSRGWIKPPRDLAHFQEESKHAEAFRDHSRSEFDRLEYVWESKRPEYERQIRWEAEEIEKARTYVKVVDQNPEHFKKVWEREDKTVQQERHRGDRSRERDRGMSR